MGTAGVFLPENNKRNLIIFERMLAEYDKEQDTESFARLLQRLFADDFAKNRSPRIRCACLSQKI